MAGQSPVPHLRLSASSVDASCCLITANGNGGWTSDCIAHPTAAGYCHFTVSIPAPLQELRDAIAQRGGSAYLLTVSDDLRPHAVHVAVQWDGEVLAAEVGKRSAANATARPNISLLYTVRHDGDYSLIVDGTAQVAGSSDAPRLLITPTKAVLHRPAVTPDPSSTCSADCVPLLPPIRPGS